jgi:hypothetical protein
MKADVAKKALTTFYVIAIPLLAVVGYSLLIKPQFPVNAYTPGQLDEMLALADKAAMPASALPDAALIAQASNETEPPRGAPIDAPVEGGDGLLARPPAEGGVITSIPQESLDLIEQAEGGAAATKNGEFVFEKTPDNKFFKVAFSQLGGYDFDLPMPKTLREAEDPVGLLAERIPESIRKLDQEPIVVIGFMVPVEITREGKLKSFALTQNQAFCCYGIPPKINEWIMVTCADAIEVDTRLDVPVACYGSLEVGGEVDDGYVLGIYRMEATEVIDVKALLRRAEDNATGGADRHYGE